MLRKPAFILLAVLGMSFHSAVADEIRLKNGDRISGNVIHMEENTLVFETSYAGKISIKWGDVIAMSTDSPTRVVLSDETSLIGIAQPAEEGKMKLKMGKIVETVSFDLADVKAISPKPKAAEPAIKIKGHINVGASVTKGNTDTETFHMDAEVVARTEKNRYTVGGELNRAKDDGEDTVNNAIGYMKYDHFLTQKWYVYSGALFEKDEFKDLNLRTALGAGVGYQFWETPVLNLSVEVGLAYVNADFDEGEDDHYPAGRWAVNFDKYFLDKMIQFFHFHEGFIGLDDIFIRSQTGLRFPLYKAFNATAQYNLDWENNPAPDWEQMDEMYLFTLGYQW